MSEIVERVARAIYGKLVVHHFPLATPSPDAFDQENDWRKAQMRDWARTAIEAMREPTQAMMEAGYDAEPGGAYNAHYGSVWVAMIEEALK